jgi:hypothetical protein
MVQQRAVSPILNPEIVAINQGDGTAKNVTLAIEWLLVAAEFGRDTWVSIRILG